MFKQLLIIQTLGLSFPYNFFFTVSIHVTWTQIMDVNEVYL